MPSHLLRLQCECSDSLQDPRPTFIEFSVFYGQKNVSDIRFQSLGKPGNNFIYR